MGLRLGMVEIRVKWLTFRVGRNMSWVDCLSV